MRNWKEWRTAAAQLSSELDKARAQHRDITWYPYQTLKVFEVLPAYAQARSAEWFSEGVRGRCGDLGCGDGDLAFLLWRLGAPEVHCFDRPDTNINGKAGVDRLRRELGAGSVQIAALDFDRERLPVTGALDLGVAFGLLYHLRDPLGFLTRVSEQVDRLVLSTRVARRTPGGRDMDEQLAYLLHPRETNNDATNYWIFSPSGLLRCLDVAGFDVSDSFSVNATADSDPVRKDERMFVFARSRHVNRFELLGTSGLHEPGEGENWFWSLPRFALRVRGSAGTLRLRILLTEERLAAGPVEVRMRAGEEHTVVLDMPGYHWLEVVLDGAREEQDVEYEVLSGAFRAAGDDRDLGILLPGSRGSRGMQPTWMFESK